MAIPGGKSRRLSRFIAGLLALLLVLLSPGLEGYQAFAAATPTPKPHRSTPSKAPAPPGGGLSISRIPDLSLTAAPVPAIPRADLPAAQALVRPLALPATPVPAYQGTPLQRLAAQAADAQRPFLKRVEAVHALRKEGGPEALALLSRLGRYEPGAGADAFDGSAEGRLAAQAADPEASFSERVEAARSLLRLGDRAKPALATLRQAGALDYEVKREALRALAQHGRLQGLPQVTPLHAAELLASRPEAVVFGPGTWMGKDAEASGAALSGLAKTGIETTVLGGRQAVEALPLKTRTEISAIVKGRVAVFDAEGDARAVNGTTGGSRLEAAVHLVRTQRDRLVRVRDAVNRLSVRWRAAAARLLSWLPSSRVPAAKTWAVSRDSRAVAGAVTVVTGEFADPREDGVVLWNANGPRAGAQIARALAKPEPAAVDKKAMGGLFTSRTLSIIAFVGTSLAYPFIAKSALGGGSGAEAMYATVMALGQLGSIVAGPMAGWLSSRYSPNKVMKINVLLRLVLALELPIFFALGLLAPGTPQLLIFAILLMGSFANYFVLSSIMATEGTYLKRFVGEKNLGTANSLLQINYFAIQVLLGLIAGAGQWIDGLRELGLKFTMIPFLLSAALHAVIFPIISRAIPKDSPLAVPKPRRTSSRVRVLKRLGLFLRRHRVEAVLLAAALVSFPFLHSAIPIGAALLLWVSRSKAGRRLLSNKPMRNAVLLASFAGAILMPFQYFILQAAASSLSSAGAGSLILGKLWGALFLGQMISGSSLAKLPALRVPFFGRFGLQRLVQLGVLGIGAAWVFTGLFPGSWVAVAAAVALGAVMMALAERLTDRGWVMWAGAGAATLALPIIFWGSVPIFFASVLMLGFFFGPALITLQSYFQRSARDQHMGGVVGVQSSIFNTAISLGFGLLALMSSSHKFVGEMFPGLLIPVLALFMGVGALYYIAVRRGALPGLSATSLKPKDS